MSTQVPASMTACRITTIRGTSPKMYRMPPSSSGYNGMRSVSANSVDQKLSALANWAPSFQ